MKPVNSSLKTREMDLLATVSEDIPPFEEVFSDNQETLYIPVSEN